MTQHQAQDKLDGIARRDGCGKILLWGQSVRLRGLLSAPTLRRIAAVLDTYRIAQRV